MKEDFLREFPELPYGVPCHDAYSRLFRLMKPDSFQASFDKFRTDFAAEQGAEQGQDPAIAIDGKEMRRSFDKAAGKSNMNIVTAFADGARLTLGVTQSAKGGGGILALRELIGQFDIRGITITADALHCQRETCDLIVQEGGDYCLQPEVIRATCCPIYGPLWTINILIKLTNTYHWTRSVAASGNGHIASMKCRGFWKRRTTGRISKPSSMLSPNPCCRQARNRRQNQPL